MTPNETAIFTANQFGTVQNNSLNRHNNGDDHGSCSEMYAVQSMSSERSEVSCVIKVVQTEGTKEFLVWPDTPKRKGKRQMKRQPYAITSRRYQEVFEKKKFAKHRAEEEKEARKQKRIEAKEKDKLELILLAPVVIKLSHMNLGEAYVVMIVTTPSMKNVFQNTIRSTFPFLKMEMNSSVTCYKVKPFESSRPSNKKWKKKVITMNMMMMMMMMI